jgi:SAM-dependent methyltransferase
MTTDAVGTCLLDVCPVCSCPVKPWKAKTTPHGSFPIVGCIECGFAFVNPRPSSDFLRDFYTELGQGDRGVRSVDEVLRTEQDYPNSSLDAKRMLNTVVRVLPRGGPRRLLDVGCGYGLFSREARVQGFDVCALEPASVERGIAEKMLGVRPIPMSFEEFPGPEGSFAAILMSQILEHALDVNLWIEKAHRLLAPNGVLAIALPNFGSFFRLILQEREPYICPPAHLNFFGPENLSRLLDKKGFVVREVQWVLRLDPRVLFERIPVTRFLGEGVAIPLRLMLKLIDSLHLGMMVNIYGQKPPA